MNTWMAVARDEAIKGMENNEGGPFGAAIVRNGELITAAHNEVLKTNDPTAHAEINAIRRASAALNTFDLSDCILYTTCYPCPMCLGAILWARISTVYYASTMEDAAQGGFDDKAFYALFNNPQTALAINAIDNEEGKKLFSRWLEKSDRTLY
jgi:guanine deaminase